jgi:hypothetical protein
MANLIPLGFFFSQALAGVLEHRLGVGARPGALLERPLLDHLQEALEFVEIRAVDVEAVDEVSIAADADGPPGLFGHAAGDDALEVGQGEDVHVGGLVGVAGPPMGVHVEDEPALVVREHAEPEPLQAGRIVRLSVELGIPGDGLGPAGVAGPGQAVDDGGDLVDRLALDVVREQALVVGVGPLALFWADPVVVNPLDDFLAVDLEVLEAAGEGPVDARLGEGVLDRPEHRAIAARRIARLVVFRLDGDALAPAGEDGLLPGLREGPPGDGQGRDISIHGLTSVFPPLLTHAGRPVNAVVSSTTLVTPWTEDEF